MIPFRAHAHRADDIMTAIRIAKEFSVRLSSSMARTVIKIATGARRSPGSGGAWPSGSKFVAMSNSQGATPESPRILIENGVLTAFSTDHPVIAIQNMRLQATTQWKKVSRPKRR